MKLTSLFSTIQPHFAVWSFCYFFTSSMRLRPSLIAHDKHVLAWIKHRNQFFYHLNYFLNPKAASRSGAFNETSLNRIVTSSKTAWRHNQVWCDDATMFTDKLSTTQSALHSSQKDTLRQRSMEFTKTQSVSKIISNESYFDFFLFFLSIIACKNHQLFIWNWRVNWLL